jgi:hypothetical protein
MKIVVTFLTLFIFSFSFEDNEIIRIPYGVKEFTNVQTKYGPISSKLKLLENTPTFNDWRDVSPNTVSFCLLNIKNTNLFYSTFYQNYKNTSDSIFINVNERIFNNYWKDKDSMFNSFICESLYRTKYIDNYIYTIGNNEDNEKYLFFGGTPKNLINNLNHYSFGKYMVKNELISFNVIIANISFAMADGIKLNFKLSEKLISSFELSEDIDAMICVSDNYYNDFYKENEKYLKDKNFEHFSLTFKIDDKIFSLSDMNGNTLDYITLCDRFILGKKFLELFDYREYNFETKIVNFYLNKNKKYIVREKEETKKEISTSNSKIEIILFSIFLGMTLVTFAKSYSKNKGIGFYYNEKYILDF